MYVNHEVDPPELPLHFNFHREIDYCGFCQLLDLINYFELIY